MCLGEETGATFREVTVDEDMSGYRQGDGRGRVHRPKPEGDDAL